MYQARKVSSLTPPLFIEVPVPSQESEEGLNCSLSWIGTDTSIKSGGAKPLTFLG
jgi:hypothetical protein